MTKVPHQPTAAPTSLCPECGTPADADIPTYARARTRRSLIPLIVVALLLGTVVAGTFLTWSPAPFTWNTSQISLDPFPIPALNSVAELQSLLDGPVVPSTRLRDALLHDLETRDFTRYESDRGELQVTLSTKAGTVTDTWRIGWPVSTIAGSDQIHYSNIPAKSHPIPPPHYGPGASIHATLAGLSFNSQSGALMLNLGWPLLIATSIWTIWPLIARMRKWAATGPPRRRRALRYLGVILVLAIAAPCAWPTTATRVEYDPWTTPGATPAGLFGREYRSTGLTRSAAIEKLKAAPNDAAVAREMFTCVDRLEKNNPELDAAMPMLVFLDPIGVTNSAVFYGWPTPLVTMITETWPSDAPESPLVRFRYGELQIATRSSISNLQRTFLSISLMSCFALLAYLTLAWHITRFLIRRHLAFRSTTRRAIEHCIACNYPLPSSNFDGTSILTAAHHRREARARASTPDNPPPAS